MSADGEQGGVLLPCPFCGSGILDWAISGGDWAVMCRNCNAQGPLEDSDHDAIPAWNTRATTAADTTEVVKLREALGELETRSVAVMTALDKYNAEHGTYIGGAPFFKIGLAIAKVRAALAKHPTSPEDAA